MTACDRGWGRERGRHRIWGRFQALSCQHRAQHRAWTHGLRAHDLLQSRTLNWLNHPGAPKLIFLKGIRSASRFSLFIYFFMWMSSCSSTICWKAYLCCLRFFVGIRCFSVWNIGKIARCESAVRAWAMVLDGRLKVTLWPFPSIRSSGSRLDLIINI